MESYEEYMKKCEEAYWKMYEQANEKEMQEKEKEKEKDEQMTTELQDFIENEIKEYMEQEVLHMSNPDFHENMVDDIAHIVYQFVIDIELFEKESYDIVVAFVREQCDLYFENKNNVNCPTRHNDHIDHEYYSQKYDMTDEFVEIYLKDKINLLRKKNDELPKQRSPEWYEQRSQMMTASNIWQLFSSEAQINRFIYDKCKPSDMEVSENKWINTTSSLHWGVKYEPLTVMIYESMMDAKIEDFGCIPHSNYKFIGASPDGIVTNIDSQYYGRMVEIKNIFNREMDGIPSEAYWTQMQIQMECCDLNACDFIETRFKEYENAEAYYDEEQDEKTRGIILNMITKDGTSNIPTYKYWINDGTPLEPWIEQMKMEDTTKAIYEIIYWYLDDIQITTVERNKAWFDNALPILKKYWETIEYERIHGYEHRAAKKRVQTSVITIDTDTDTHIIRGMPTSPEGVCLIKIPDDPIEDVEIKKTI